MTKQKSKYELLGPGSEPHLFADHQFCLKCGKWEGLPVADDCPVTHEQFLEAERARPIAPQAAKS